MNAFFLDPLPNPLHHNGIFVDSLSAKKITTFFVNSLFLAIHSVVEPKFFLWAIPRL